VSGAPTSILRTLGWRLALISLVLLALIVVLLEASFSTAADALFRKALEEEARAIAARLEPTASGELRFIGREPLVDEPPLVRFRVLDEAGAVLFTSTDLPRGLETAAAGEESHGGTSFLELGAPMSRDRVMRAELAVNVGSRRPVVQIFESFDQRGELLDDLVRSYFLDAGWLLVPFVALMLLVNLLTIRAALKPLADVSRMASEIGPETADLRLPEEGQPREVMTLTQSVNRALERLDQAFQIQRRFTADAAHELRTPIAVLNARLDWLGNGEAVAALRQEIAGMNRLVNQLLRIAELDSLAETPNERVDLHALAVEAAAALGPLAIKEGKSIGLSALHAPVWVRGDGEALSHALRNLIENALSHTPKGTTVEIEVGPGRKVRIIDSGPGVPAEYRELIFQRFWRADRRKGGAGLGLAIVAKVAETHAGRVYVEKAPRGGAAFVFELPAPDGIAAPEATEARQTEDVTQ
jgi:signal transduction histidine kinase